MKKIIIPNLVFATVILFNLSALIVAQEELIVRDSVHFFFAQITDTHFGDRDNNERSKLVVDRINKLPFDIKCVVHTGDITMNQIDNYEVVSQGLDILNYLNAPLHYVPGNHDILKKDLEMTKFTYTNYYSDLIHEQEYDGVKFIFVYTEPLAHMFIPADFQPLIELKAVLDEAGDIPCIIFHHTPSVERFKKKKIYSDWHENARKEWVTLLNAYNVKAVIAGHFHRDEHHWLGNVPLYVSSSVAGYGQRQTTFRIYEYNNGRIGYRTRYIKTPKKKKPKENSKNVFVSIQKNADKVRND